MASLQSTVFPCPSSGQKGKEEKEKQLKQDGSRKLEAGRTGQAALIKKLQHDVQNVGMRLFDLIQQHLPANQPSHQKGKSMIVFFIQKEKERERERGESGREEERKATYHSVWAFLKHT